MENSPILYGKDVNTNKITSLKCIGNVLSTTDQSPSLNNLSNVQFTALSNKETLIYDSVSSKWINRPVPSMISINMYGRLHNTAYDSTTNLRKLMICSSTYWSDTPPDPDTNYQSDVVSSGFALYFMPSLGGIGLEASKRYLVNAVVNLNGINIGTTVTWELSLRNAGDGTWDDSLNSNYGSALTVPCVTRATQTIDYSGVTLSLNRVVTGVAALGLVLRTTNSVPIDTNSSLYDTAISLSVVEV